METGLSQAVGGGVLGFADDAGDAALEVWDGTDPDAEARLEDHANEVLTGNGWRCK